MRMWMTNPKIMCRKHLLGEHVECHMFIGHLERQRGLDGYIRENCIEMLSIHDRHKELAEEMESRGYNHKSPLEFMDTMCVYNYDQWQRDVKVDREKSLNELLTRCPECKKRAEKMNGGE